MFAGSKFKKGAEEMLPAYEAANSRNGVRFGGIQEDEERLQTGSRI